MAGLEKTLTSDALKKWTSELSEQEVKVWIPAFELDAGFRLAETLRSLGMKTAFTSAEADFSAINGKKDLFLSAVVHKAYVQVNEQGTEAAAATGAAMKLTAIPEPVPEFRADHPFLFLIRDRKTETILFMGRFTRP